MKSDKELKLVDTEPAGKSNGIQIMRESMGDDMQRKYTRMKLWCPHKSRKRAQKELSGSCCLRNMVRLKIESFLPLDPSTPLAFVPTVLKYKVNGTPRSLHVATDHNVVRLPGGTTEEMWPPGPQKETCSHIILVHL